MPTEAQILTSLYNELVPGVCLLAFLPGIRGRNNGEIESVFHYQLCKTNPISKKVK